MLDSDRLTQVLTPLGSVMVDVAVIGAGQTKYGNHQLGLKGMWAEAAENAFSSVDKDFDPRQVDEAFIGSVAFGGAQLGNTAALLTEHSGLDGIPVRRVENACASSGFALRDAWMAIKSGQADIVVAGGICLLYTSPSPRDS